METKEDRWSLKNFDKYIIRMRNIDGYLCATDMCKINNKKISHYFENERTCDFITKLEIHLKKSMVGYPISGIVEKNHGNSEFRGTWVHPKVAIHLAMWIDQDFSIQVIEWIERFIKGDITLVQEIVDRHDAVNNTQSQVLITTMTNQLQEYKDQVETLTNKIEDISRIKDTLKEQVDRLNEFVCSYCNRRYSSTAGLTRHLNKNCVDKLMREMSLTLDFTKFKSYIDLLMKYIIEDFNYKVNTKGWDTNDPVLIIFNDAKKYNYKIRYNESRWRVVKFLNKYINIPLTMILDEVATKFLEDNKPKLKTLQSSLSRQEEDYTLAEEFRMKLGIVEDE